MSVNQEMPVVGKSFYAHCKKCETDRYHTVHALPTAESAKIECEVCHKKSTWKPVKAKAPGVARGAAARAKEAAAGARATAHANEYESLLKESDESSEAKYSMKSKFDKLTKVSHPTFGLGVVRYVQPDKIEVVFKDEVRTLVHNRG